MSGRPTCPPPAEAVDPRESFPVRYDMSYSVTKEAAEIYRLALMTPVERLIDGHRPALVGDEVQFVEPRRSVTEPDVKNTNVVNRDDFSPRLDSAQTYAASMQVPFAPPQGRPAATPSGKTGSNGAKGEVSGGGSAEGGEDDAVQFTDEGAAAVSEKVAVGARPNASAAYQAVARQQAARATGAVAAAGDDDEFDRHAPRGRSRREGGRT